MTAKEQFIQLVHAAFTAGKKLTVRDLRKFADQTGLPDEDKNLWEYTELAWVLWYRRLSAANYPDHGVMPFTVKHWFETLVDFYQKVQPTFTARDSTRQIFQQYSTAGPISALAGWFCDGGWPTTKVFEPSAGNGLLTIYYPPEDVSVNEIDQTRNANLQLQGYASITNLDASQPFPASMRHRFDIILTNPPFGTLGDVNTDYGWKFRKLDHVMVAHALETMGSHGRAAILIGGHTEFDEKTGFIKSGRAFFDWLFRHYRVIDMINIDSEKLYAKQGTTFPLRLILVAGRKQVPFGFAPNRRESAHFSTIATTFEQLLEIIGVDRKNAAQRMITLDDLLRDEVGKISMETNHLS